MRRLGFAIAVCVLGCSSDPGNELFPTGQPGPPDAAGDAQVTGVGGSAGAAPDAATEAAAGAGGGGTGGASGAGGAAPDGGVDTYIAPDAGQDTRPDTAPDSGQDAATPDATPDGGAPDVRPDTAPPGTDAGQDAVGPDAAPAPDVRDAPSDGLPPGCNYEIEPVPEATAPYAFCSATSASRSGTYQFSELRFRRPINTPGPIDAFAGGTMTVRNGATLNTYNGAMWATKTGEEVIFRGTGGAAIVFTTGVQQITVTSTDQSALVGCLPQPCTWTVTQ